MVSSTTLFFHTSTTIFTFRASTDTLPIALYPGVANSTILPSGFALYVPFSTNTRTGVNASVLVEALGTLYPLPRRSLPIFGFNPASPTTTLLSRSVTPVNSQDTLYIPVTGNLSATVPLNSLTLALSSAHATVSSIAASSTSSSSTAGSASSPTRASGASSTSSTRTAQSKETTPTGVSKGISTGALAGGVVGAFIVGLLCAFIAFWCIRRRSSRRPSTQARSDGSSQGTLLARDTSSQEKPHPAVVASDLTGWRKHLPQEKDDRTITRAFQLLFEHVQLHVEGFYETKPGPVSPESIETLRNLSSDDFPRLLTQTKDVIPLLEGILVRWLVHRISGLSSAEESLLPLELAKIPEKNKWHMENDVEGNGLIAENKRGTIALNTAYLDSPASTNKNRISASFLSVAPAYGVPRTRSRNW